jgi:hypothetical protein
LIFSLNFDPGDTRPPVIKSVSSTPTTTISHQTVMVAIGVIRALAEQVFANDVEGEVDVAVLTPIEKPVENRPWKN